MKIYVAGPLRALVDKENNIKPEYVEKIEKLRIFLKEKGYEVYIPHEFEGYAEAKKLSVDEIALNDFNEIRSSDIVICYPGDPPSGGTCVELGWATAWAKRVILLLKRTKDYSSLIKGISELDRVIVIGYSNNEMGFNKLEKILTYY